MDQLFDLFQLLFIITLILDALFDTSIQVVDQHLRICLFQQCLRCQDLIGYIDAVTPFFQPLSFISHTSPPPQWGC